LSFTILQPEFNPKVSNDYIIVIIQKRLNQAVIGLTLCPYAKLYKKLLYLHINHANYIDGFLDPLAQKIGLLLQITTIELETTLVIKPILFNTFDPFLQIVELNEQALRENKTLK
jgi:hypothetical protein